MVVSKALEDGEPLASSESNVERVNYMVYELGQSENSFFTGYFGG